MDAITPIQELMIKHLALGGFPRAVNTFETYEEWFSRFHFFFLAN
jgi:hypothetical protein